MFAVFAAAENAGAGVVLAAWFACAALCSTAAAPTFAMPETATVTISPAVFEPVATVTVVLVVFASSELRTKHESMSPELLCSAVLTSVYAPPLLSLHVGDALVLPLTLQKTTNRSPTTGVVAAPDRSPVLLVPPPAVLVR